MGLSLFQHWQTQARLRPVLRIAFFLVAGLALARAASGQQATFHDPLLDRMQGSWVLEGTIAGERTVHDVSAQWVLNHQYLRLHEVSRERTSAGQPAYEAMVFIGWDEPNQTYACVWLDNFGGISTQSLGVAPRSGDSLAFVFTNRNGSLTRNTMTYDPARRRWTWRIVEEENGRTRLFADVTLRPRTQEP